MFVQPLKVVSSITRRAMTESALLTSMAFHTCLVIRIMLFVSDQMLIWLLDSHSKQKLLLCQLLMFVLMERLLFIMGECAAIKVLILLIWLTLDIKRTRKNRV